MTSLKKTGPISSAACALAATLACGGGCGSDGRQEITPVELDRCPTALEEPSAKITFDNNGEGVPVAIVLRQESLPSLGTCGDGSGCAIDATLIERQKLNHQELNCVLATLKGLDQSSLVPLWYEDVRHLSTGETVPIGLAFQLQLGRDQIEAIASHPFVERVSLSPGSDPPRARLFRGAQFDCARGTEDPTLKVQGFAPIVGNARVPAVVEMRDAGSLPPERPCPEADLCKAEIAALWERTIINTRNVSCLGVAFDEVVAEKAANVPYVSYEGAFGGPLLPPFAQAPLIKKSLGRQLTVKEARELAKLPYVERIWTSPDLQAEPTVDGCPTDVAAPIVTPTCDPARESGSGKISSADAAQFAMTPDMNDVVIIVKGGAKICPLPSCSTSECPQRDAVLGFWQVQNMAAQTCVRSLVATLGGTVVSEAGGLVNAFEAVLTWPQIMEVATHPHVVSIESNRGAPP